MTAITLADLTTGTLDGTGVFDKLMKAAKAHLDQEFTKGAIRGPEYAQVYLGQLQAAMSNALSFIAQRERIGLEAELLQKQIEQIQAQTDLVKQQILNAQQDNLLAQAQINKLNAETANVPKQGALIVAQTALAEQEKLNAVIQGTVLVAQECLLRSQYDASQATVLKTGKETDLLNQKIVTEKAQVLALGVDDNSVVGKQKSLYQAQIDGFKSDRIQKVLNSLLQTWQTRRMTDEGTVADGVNKLNDATLGRAVDKALADIGA